jgi:hypothetical protein
MGARKAFQQPQVALAIVNVGHVAEAPRNGA